MADIITPIIVIGGLYYLYTTGTIDKIFSGLGSGGGAYTGGNARPYKAAAPAKGGTGNSPGWYTEGPWGSGHHHCDWKAPGCYCTDVPKCLSSGTPPYKAGDCKPQWGTSGYLGGGPYPATADFSKCPPGTT